MNTAQPGALSSEHTVRGLYAVTPEGPDTATLLAKVRDAAQRISRFFAIEP